MTTPTTTVPTEPTEAMLDACETAARLYYQGVDSRSLWAHIIAAAPDPLPRGDLREAVAQLQFMEQHVRLIGISKFEDFQIMAHERDEVAKNLRTVLAALLTPARSGWLPADVPPDISVGDERWYIVAVKRGHSGSIHSFGAAYLNGVEMYDEDDNSAMTMTGWYDTSNDDGRTLYNPVIGNEDELMGWQEFPLFQPLPEAPSAGGEP